MKLQPLSGGIYSWYIPVKGEQYEVTSTFRRNLILVGPSERRAVAMI